jgi:hypothetical protein
LSRIQTTNRQIFEIIQYKKSTYSVCSLYAWQKLRDKSNVITATWQKLAWQTQFVTKVIVPKIRLLTRKNLNLHLTKFLIFDKFDRKPDTNLLMFFSNILYIFILCIRLSVELIKETKTIPDSGNIPACNPIRN